MLFVVDYVFTYRMQYKAHFFIFPAHLKRESILSSNASAATYDDAEDAGALYTARAVAVASAGCSAMSLVVGFCLGAAATRVFCSKRDRKMSGGSSSSSSNGEESVQTVSEQIDMQK